jgi:hypothetical protein
MAVIMTVAVSHKVQRCTYCQTVHTVESGGPSAALDGALRYLDAYHETDHMSKVVSAVRGLSDDDGMGPVPPVPRNGLPPVARSAVG